MGLWIFFGWGGVEGGQNMGERVCQELKENLGLKKLFSLKKFGSQKRKVPNIFGSQEYLLLTNSPNNIRDPCNACPYNCNLCSPKGKDVEMLVKIMITKQSYFPAYLPS